MEESFYNKKIKSLSKALKNCIAYFSKREREAQSYEVWVNEMERFDNGE